MALNVFELFGKIAIDSNDAKSGIDSAVGHAENAENKLAKTFKKIGTAFAAAFSVKAIIDFGKQCTETYASIAAEESAFAQIMGDYAETAQAKMEAVADQTGVVSTRLTASMTSLTAKFKGLGYNVEDATTLAADGLLIASDAAAFWDMSLDDAMSHLNSFINGSYEGGEAIGLFANDTQMAAYAVEKGIVADTKAWSALDEATKQATRLDYAKNMQEQSGATGQAAKESQEYANVMANLKEHWRQFLGVVGKPILEKIVLPALQKLNDFVPKLTESVQNGIVWLEEGFDKIASYFTDVFTEDGLNLDALPDALSNMFRDLGKSAGRLLANFGRTLKNGWSNTVWPMIQKTFKAVFGIELPDWATVKADISDGWNNKVWPAVQGFFTKTFGIDLPSWPQFVTDISDGWNNKVWPAIKDFFSPLFAVNLEDGTSFVERITDWWNNTVLPALSGLFEAIFEVKPEDTDGTEVGAKIREWWDLAVAAIGNIFKAIFSVGTEDDNGESTGEKIVAWWKSVVAYIGNIFRGFFGIDTEDETNVVNMLIGWWENIMGLLGDAFSATFNLVTSLFADDGVPWTDKIKKWWNDIITSLGDTISANFKLEIPIIMEVVNSVKQWWSDVCSELGESFFGFTSSLNLPSISEIVEEIEKWWEEAMQNIKISLPFGLGNLFGTDETGTEAEPEVYGPPTPEWFTYTDANTGGSTATGNIIGTLLQQLSTLKEDVRAATNEGVSEGLNGVTINAYVSAGDVKLDGKTVGTMAAPYVNCQLGWLNKLNRG